jgi:hypothetical protein
MTATENAVIPSTQGLYDRVHLRTQPINVLHRSVESAAKSRRNGA